MRDVSQSLVLALVLRVSLLAFKFNAVLNVDNNILAETFIYVMVATAW